MASSGTTRGDPVDAEPPLAAGRVAVAEQVQAAVLGVHEVRIDIALGPGVPPVGVVVEVDAAVLAHGRPQDLEHLDPRAAEVDVEHLAGVDAQHRRQLGDPPRERAVVVGARQGEDGRPGREQRRLPGPA